MLNTEHFILLVGKPEKWDGEVRQQASRVADQNAGLNLPELQEDQHTRGRRSVELIKSAYGWTVRSCDRNNNLATVGTINWPQGR